MVLKTRAYEHPADFTRLAEFLSRARSAVHNTHTLHVGDLSWQLFHMLAGYPPEDLVQIWEEPSAEILGFVLISPAFGFFDVQLDPNQRGGELEAEMLDWAEQHLTHVENVHALVNQRDSQRLRWLIRRGYQPDGEWLYLERQLKDPLPYAPPPPGYILRSTAGDQDAAARAAVLAEAFGAVPQPERYQQFMHSPGYVADLDIVAAAPDQRFAAFAMCWVDPLTRVGQFEPVGTSPDFRRQGLGQAVLYEGLRRMLQHGAERAIVIVEAEEKAACSLYESVGFELQWNLTLYAKSRAA